MHDPNEPEHPGATWPLKLAAREGAATVSDDVPQEFVLTERPRQGECVLDVFGRLAADLRQRHATITSLLIYGSVREQAEIANAMTQTLGKINWPVTWVEAASCDGSVLAGVQAFAVAGCAVRRIILGGRVAGSVYEDGSARHCLLGGLVPPVVSQSRATQAQALFDEFGVALGLAGFALADVVRTWFYNDDILAWYGDFNRVRTGVYQQVLFRTGSTPASTGIGARNVSGAALEVAAWAVQPLDAAARVEEIGSPLQCPAPAYGSSFSRAMEVASGGRRRLFISGTASITPDGRTAWVGDIVRQVDLTMEVVGAILRSRGMEFSAINRATAYFRSPADVKHFERWCAEHGQRALPYVAVESIICRDDLLWEIEVDACVAAE